MPRAPRLDAPGALHHVSPRSLNGQAIFLDDEDRADLLSRLTDVVEAGLIRLWTWSLMNTHFHFLLESGDPGVSLAMKILLGGYAARFNRRHGRRGYLFEGRFCSRLVARDSHLLEVVRYIHLNPVVAGIIDFKDLDRFRWTGHRCVMGFEALKFQEPAMVLSLFGAEPADARRAYQQFLLDGMQRGISAPNESGLRLRQGGWVPTGELERGRECWTFDERIIGGDPFIRASVARRMNRDHQAAVAQRSDPTLDQVANQIARELRLPPASLRTGSKVPRLVAARSVVCWLAIRLLGRSPLEVAEYLSVSPRSVQRAAREGERTARKLWLNIEELLERLVETEPGQGGRDKQGDDG